MPVDDGRGTHVGGGNVAACFGKGRGLCRSWLGGTVDEVLGMVGGMRKQPTNHVWVVAGVVGHLGDRAFSEVVIPGKACASCPMFDRCPQSVVALRVFVCAGEPFEVGLRTGGGVLGHFENSQRQKGRLRAGEKVGAVGVQDRAVVFGLKKEVFNHAAREVVAAAPNKAEEDEIAIPSVHLAEADRKSTRLN